MRATKIILTLLIILLINITLTGFLEITVKRPVLYYEYLLLPVVLIIAKKHWLRVAIFISLLGTDLILNLSHIYFFDLFNYVEKLPSLLISKFSIQFWVLIILGLLGLVFLSNFLIKLFELKISTLGKNRLSINIIISIFTIMLVYTIDSFNGSTMIEYGKQTKNIRSIKIFGKKQLNIGKSLIKDVYYDYKIYSIGKKSVHEIADFKNLNNDSSLAYKFFYNSKGNKEVLIILESWGLLKDMDFRALQLAPIYQLDSSLYKIKFDSSYFDGATVQAESRELLNKQGEAYFSVINNENCDIKGLVQRKSENGYKTIAMQSFPGSYSLGNKFNALIGFKDFKEYKFFHDTLKLHNNYDNHYTSVNDEDVFFYLFNNLNKSSFNFCLTINTHLPFSLSYKVRQKSNFKDFREKYGHQFPSKQTLERYYKMKSQLNFLAEIISKGEADRILIIGDHTPPFLYNEERKLFIPNLVPAIFLEKK